MFGFWVNYLFYRRQDFVQNFAMGNVRRSVLQVRKQYKNGKRFYCVFFLFFYSVYKARKIGQFFVYGVCLYCYRVLDVCQMFFLVRRGWDGEGRGYFFWLNYSSFNYFLVFRVIEFFFRFYFGMDFLFRGILLRVVMFVLRRC